MSENKINSGKVFSQKHAAEAQTASETEKEQFERLRSQSTSSESDGKQKHRCWVPRKCFLVFAGISMALLTIAITLTAIFMLSQNGKDSTSGIDSEDAEVQVEPCSDMFCAGEHHLKIQDDTCECVLSENGHDQKIKENNTFSLGSSLDDDEIEPDYTDCLLMMCHSEASATMVDGICECVIQEQFRCDYAWDWSTEKQVDYSTDLDCFGPGETECGRFIDYHRTFVRTPKWVTCEEWDMFDSDICGWFAFYQDFEEYEKCRESEETETVCWFPEPMSHDP